MMTWVLAHPEAILIAIGYMVGVILWFSRLESKHTSLEKRVEILEELQKNFDGKVAGELREMNTRLAHIEGYLKKFPEGVEV